MSNSNSPANTSVSEGLSAMFDAAQSGGDLRGAFNAPDSVSKTPVELLQPSPSTMDESSTEQPKPTDTNSENAEPEEVDFSAKTSKEDDEEAKETDSKAPAKQVAGDIEEIVITDSQGQRKIKIDYSDKEKMRKYVQLAAGARKWQAERDQERTEKSKLNEEYSKIKTDMSKFEQAYGQGGFTGIKQLVETLEGPGSFDKFLKEAKAEQERWEDLDPAERRAELLSKEKSEIEKREKARDEEIQKLREELTADKHKAEQLSMESKLHPAFDRYRFAGKLGDEVVEHHYDQALWSQVRERLAGYPDDVELTQAIIDKEFRTVSQAFSKAVTKQVDKKVQSKISETKQNATSKAQATVSKGMASTTASDKFKEDIRGGNIKSALTALFDKKVRLS